MRSRPLSLLLSTLFATSASAASFTEVCAAGLKDAGKRTFLNALGISKAYECGAVYEKASNSIAMDLAFKGVTDISLLPHFPQLEHLELNGNPVKTLEPIRALTKLRVLILNARPITNIDALSSLKALEELTLDSSAVTSLAPLKGLPKLRELYLREGPKLKDIAAVADMPALQTLYVHSDLVPDFSVIGKAKSLTKLSVGGKNLKSLAFVADLKDLEELGVSGPKVELAPVAKLSKLRMLQAERCGLTDLSALKGLTKLTELYVGFNKIKDLSPLKTTTALTTLRISENPVKSLMPISELPLSHLEVMTGTVEKTDGACPVDIETTNEHVRKFCLRFRKIQ